MDEDTQRALLQYLLSMGYLGPQSLQSGGFVVPGGGEPSGDQKRAYDLLQDYNSVMADPMFAAQAGGQAIDAAAFAPIREYVEGPQNQRFLTYSQKPLDTLEGWMADLVKREGALGVTAAAQQFLNADPELLDPEQLKIRQQLEQFSYTDPVSGETRTDLEPLREIASELEQEQYLQADPNAQYEAETGRWYIETPSAMSEKFSELGLPSPYEQYTPFSLQGLPDAQTTWDQAGLGDLQEDIYARGLAQNEARRQATAAEQAAMARMALGDSRGAPQVPPGPAPAVAPTAEAAPEVTQAIGRSILGAGATPATSGADADMQYAIDRAVMGEEAAQAALQERMANGALGQIPSMAKPTYASGRRPRGAKAGEPAPEGRAGSRGANARSRSRNRRATQRAEQVRNEPSATMQAYRNFYNQLSKVYDSDFGQAWFDSTQAQRQGRTPLSDTLAARRAQAVASGLPLGWG